MTRLEAPPYASCHLKLVILAGANGLHYTYLSRADAEVLNDSFHLRSQIPLPKHIELFSC